MTHVKYSSDCVKLILKRSIYNTILFTFKYLVDPILVPVFLV